MKSKLSTTSITKTALCAAMIALGFFAFSAGQVSAYEDEPWRCEFCDSLVWPPGQSQAHMAWPPLTILNPFVEQPGYDIEPPQVITSAPLTVLNPFCKKK